MRMLATAALTLALFGGVAEAAPRGDVQRVAAMVTDSSVPVLLRESFGENGNQVVFVQDGIRYTIYNSGARIDPANADSAWLSVWTRPDGTHDQASMVTFSDHGFDGDVDFGTGDGQGDLFWGRDSTLNQPARGVEFRARWQREYDAAIAAAIRYLDTH